MLKLLDSPDACKVGEHRKEDFVRHRLDEMGLTIPSKADWSRHESIEIAKNMHRLPWQCQESRAPFFLEDIEDHA